MTQGAGEVCSAARWCADGVRDLPQERELSTTELVEVIGAMPPTSELSAAGLVQAIIVHRQLRWRMEALQIAALAELARRRAARAANGPRSPARVNGKRPRRDRMLVMYIFLYAINVQGSVPWL